MATVRKATTALCTLALLGLSGCGDADTEDARGYTKAPLEDPGVFVSPEPATIMDALGEPDRQARPRRPDEAEDVQGGSTDG